MRYGFDFVLFEISGKASLFYLLCKHLLILNRLALRIFMVDSKPFNVTLKI